MDTLKRWLPVPTGPVMDVVRRMYGGFEDLEKEVQKLGEPLGEWTPIENSGFPEFPDGLNDEFGPGEALLLTIAEEGHPRWP